MRDDVQSWLDAPAFNYGWMLVGDESEGQTAKRFDSRQRVVASARPRLTIHYTPAPTGVAGAPRRARLLPAVPNPFNPATTLRVVLETAAHVTLTVYDVRGREVRRVVDRALGRGEHAFLWNGADANGLASESGVYFVRLDVRGSPPQARKVILVK
jgi:hypothetical protein